MRIPTLIVDDQDDVRLLLRLIIERANDGLSVACEAATGDEALECADECDPLVVVLDEMMPGLSGVETAKRLRERRPDQIMIICSAYIDDDVVDRARAAGVVECVSKEHLQELPARILKAVTAA